MHTTKSESCKYAYLSGFQGLGISAGGPAVVGFFVFLWSELLHMRVSILAYT